MPAVRLCNQEHGQMFMVSYVVIVIAISDISNIIFRCLFVCQFMFDLRSCQFIMPRLLCTLSDGVTPEGVPVIR